MVKIIRLVYKISVSKTWNIIRNSFWMFDRK